MNILDFHAKKVAGEKITMLTCYDYTMARILADTSVDCFLVGDSAAMTMHGYKDTVPATVEMMVFHTSGVKRGAGDKFIISDLPFLSYRKSLSKSVTAVKALIQAGAQAVKLENADGNLKLVKHLVESGIPVMGHLGLSIQAVNSIGGFKVQGKTKESADKIKEDALRLQEMGCFALVLECVPTHLGKEISNALKIPTIGVGAGNGTDGQALVTQDLLGLNLDFKPKFVKVYMDGKTLIKNSIEKFVKEVKSGEFPADENSYSGK